MKVKISHIKILIISSLFLGIIGGIVFNASFFLHTHKTACGNIIIHAHPFNKNKENNQPNTQHQHNKIELLVIQSLEFFVNIDIIQDTLNPEYFLITKYNIPKCYGNSSCINKLNNNRAPPSDFLMT
ncbi:MAG TPA: hypothetical protein VK982_03590 [Bacteroidales bacterium]|nr:hypothetical protein [Bacteroidales bacterium]